jgi:hypothetical protein
MTIKEIVEKMTVEKIKKRSGKWRKSQMKNIIKRADSRRKRGI